jgi:hypothetical protein
VRTSGMGEGKREGDADAGKYGQSTVFMLKIA